jgi:chromosomal replication initiation ATPase DnaA
MTDAQLALPLDLPPALGRDDFIVGAANRDALALVEAWPDWPAPVVALSGPAGSGKSHLVAIWQGIAGGRAIAASSLTEAMVDELAASGAIAVEDIDRGSHDDAVLFHLLNRAREHGASVLLTARGPIAGAAELPDLVSRLRAAHPVALAAPDEALLAQVLVKLFADRQLSVGGPLVDYILPRIERSFSAAAILVRELDRVALATGRPVTRQLAARILRDESIVGPVDEE